MLIQKRRKKEKKTVKLKVSNLSLQYIRTVKQNFQLLDYSL